MISFTTLVLHLQSLLIYLPAIADLFKTSYLSATELNSNRDQKSQDPQLLKKRFTPVLPICYDSVLKKIYGLDLRLSILLAFLHLVFSEKVFITSFQMEKEDIEIFNR